MRRKKTASISLGSIKTKSHPSKKAMRSGSRAMKPEAGVYEENRTLKPRCRDLEIENRSLRKLHRECEDNYSSLFTEMGYGFAVHTMLYDKSGEPTDYVTVEVNSAYEKILGLKKKNAVGKKASQILPLDELKKWVGIFGRVTRSGIPEQYEMYSPLDGKYIRGYAYSPGKDRFAILFEDTAERKMAEATLRVSEERYRTLFEAVPDPIFLVDEETARLLDANPAASEKYGFSLDEFRGFRAMDISAEPEKTMKTIRVPGKSFVSYRLHKKKNGDIIPVEISSNDFKLQGNRINVSVIRDVTERKAAEDALRESEERYRGLFENAAIAIFRSLPDGAILNVNTTFAHLLGYESPEQVKALVPNASNFFAEPARRAKIVEQLSREGKLIRVEVLYRRRDGSVFTGELTVSAHRNTNNEISHIEGFIHDISGRKHAEEEVIESEERFQNFVDQAGDGFELVDENGRYIDVNRATCRMLGYSRDELLNLAVPDIDPRNNRVKFESDFRNLIGKPSSTLETLHCRKNGTIFPVEVTVTIIKRGGRYFAIMIVRDITKRKEAEDTLLESEEKYRTVTESINIGIFQSTPDGSLIYANSTLAEIAGYSGPDEFINLPVQTLFAEPSDKEGIILELVERGSVKNKEIKSVRRDGAVFWVSMNAVLLKTATGKPAYILGSIHDISDTKRAEALAEIERKRAEHFLNIAGIMIIAIDNNGIVTLINRKGCEILGYERDEIVGKNWFDNFLPAAPREDIKGVFRKLMAGEGEPVREFENAVLTKDGRERIIRWFNSITTDSRGGNTGTLSSGEDVTEQRLAESTIKHLSTFPQLSPNPIIEISMMGLILYANDAARDVLSEVGRSDLFLFFGNDCEELLRTALENKGALIHREKEIETRVFTEMIEYIEQFDCVRLYATDITERKKAEDSLRASEIRYRELFDNISSGVAIYEARENGNDFIFSDFNKAGESIDKERKEDLIGKSVLAKRPEIREFGLFDVMRRVWETGSPEHFPIHQYTDNRLTGWYENFVYKLPTGEIVAVFDNITEKKQAEEALVRREQELSNLSARLMQVREEERVKIARNVHDDIGHAAMIVKMDVFLLERHIASGSPVEQAMKAIEAIKEHLDGVVEAIQRISLEIRPPMLYDLGIADAVSFFVKRFAQQTGIACKADIWSDIPAMGNERAIGVYRIIQEALTNVYRHANATEIELAMHGKGNELYVSIVDNGKGIEDHFINNVHSLGLLGMKERAHLLEGSIEIIRRECGGTEVVLRVPLMQNKEG